MDTDVPVAVPPRKKRTAPKVQPKQKPKPELKLEPDPSAPSIGSTALLAEVLEKLSENLTAQNNGQIMADALEKLTDALGQQNQAVVEAIPQKSKPGDVDRIRRTAFTLEMVDRVMQPVFQRIQNERATARQEGRPVVLTEDNFSLKVNAAFDRILGRKRDWGGVYIDHTDEDTQKVADQERITAADVKIELVERKAEDV